MLSINNNLRVDSAVNNGPESGNNQQKGGYMAVPSKRSELMLQISSS